MVIENRVEAAGVARKELKKVSERLLLPHDVTDEAICIYKRSLKTGLANGRPLIQIAASSLYAACRERTSQQPSMTWPRPAAWEGKQ